MGGQGSWWRGEEEGYSWEVKGKSIQRDGWKGVHISGSDRNSVQGKLPGIYKDNPSKDS